MPQEARKRRREHPADNEAQEAASAASDVGVMNKKLARKIYQYGQDALVFKQPWEQWEEKNPRYSEGRWVKCNHHPKWNDPEFKYRRKIDYHCEHYKEMFEYGVDCMENEKPWEMWEQIHTNRKDEKEWEPCTKHPTWAIMSEYRKKRGMY